MKRILVALGLVLAFIPITATSAHAGPPQRDVITLSPTDPYPYHVGDTAHFVVETKLKNATYAVLLDCTWAEIVDADGDGQADYAIFHTVYSEVRLLPEALTWVIPDAGETQCIVHLGLIKRGEFSPVTGGSGEPQTGLPVVP